MGACQRSVSVYLPERFSDFPPMAVYPFMTDEYTNYLGFKFPNRPNEFVDLPESYVLFLLKHGELLDIQSSKLEGNDTLQIKIKSEYILFPWQSPNRVFLFWLIPGKNYAIKQCEILRDNGGLAYRIINDFFEKLPGKSVFVPRKTVVEHFTNENPNAEICDTVLFRETFELLDAAIKKINEGQFNLQNSYTIPGTHVADRVLLEGPVGLQYTMPANPADLDRVIEAALTGRDFVPTPIQLPLFALLFRWGLAIVGLLMIIYALRRIFTKPN